MDHGNDAEAPDSILPRHDPRPSIACPPAKDPEKQGKLPYSVFFATDSALFESSLKAEALCAGTAEGRVHADDSQLVLLPWWGAGGGCGIISA